MNKKLWLILTLLVALAMLAAQCAPAAPPAAPEQPQEEPAAEEPAVEEPAVADALADGKLTIAWIPKALNNPVFEIGKVGAETKAKELTAAGPYEVEIMYTASVASDAAEQARVMEDAIAAGVDAIGVSCNDPTACIDPIKKAIEAGVEVMTWDSDSPDSGRFTYLGVDNYEGGKAAAELMKEALPDGGQVALLTGVPGAFNLEERIRGFTDGVEGSNIEIVTTVACNDDINLGVQVVEETMQAYPDLDGWFFVGLWPLFADRGSMPLWEEAALAGMKTVAFDTLPVELEYLKEGLLYGLVGQKYWGWGYDTTQMIYDYIVNGATFDSFTNSGMDIVTAKNVDAMAKAWETQDFTQPLPPPFPEGEMAAAPMADALADGKLTIAWIPKALNNPVFEIGKVGAETKAKELTAAGPYEVEILYTASVASDAAEQARVMEDALAAGVDAIGVSCNDPTACIDPINKAIEAGVPVMTWDSDSPDSGRFTYLGVDNYEGGKAAAELMKEALPDGGQVALLTGVPGAFNLEERIRGFTDGVEGSNIEIVTTVACNDDINLGVQVVEETMQAYPDLDGWFFVGLWPLFADRGSMPLWEEAALAGMKTVAFDTLPVELEYLKEGLLYGLVGQKYWGWGYDTTQMIYDYIVNGATFDSFTNSGMDIVTAKNVDAMAKAWETQDFTQPLPPHK